MRYARLRMHGLVSLFAVAVSTVLTATEAAAQTATTAPSGDGISQLQAVSGVGGSFIVAALVEAFKGIITQKQWWPILALVFGAAWGVGVAYVLHTDLGIGFMLGIMSGLGSTGLYSSGKTLRGK